MKNLPESLQTICCGNNPLGDNYKKYLNRD